MPSLFTKIIAGQIPGEFVVRDDRWTAFLDINPANPGHLLLVPRHEAGRLADLPADTLAELGGYLARATRCVMAATGCPSVNVLVNDGPEAGQAVPHVHLHIIPRFAGDGRVQHPKGAAYPDGGLAAMGATLRAAWR
jgi:histidine triad (HIT) family protein